MKAACHVCIHDTNVYIHVIHGKRQEWIHPYNLFFNFTARQKRNFLTQAYPAPSLPSADHRPHTFQGIHRPSSEYTFLSSGPYTDILQFFLLLPFCLQLSLQGQPLHSRSRKDSNTAGEETCGLLCEFWIRLLKNGKVYFLQSSSLCCTVFPPHGYGRYENNMPFDKVMPRLMTQTFYTFNRVKKPSFFTS